MKADVLTLIDTFSNGQADATAASDYYDHVMDDLSRHPWLVGCSLVPVIQNIGTFTLDTDQGKLLAVFYDDRLLDRTTERALESHNPNWRDEYGTPLAYLTEDEAAKTYRLYPIPLLPSHAFSFVHGEPLGRDFPIYSVAILCTEIRTDVPEWLEMAVAWRALAREYGRASSHHDSDFSAFSEQLSNVLFAMVA